MQSETGVGLLASWQWRSRVGCGFKIYQTGSDAESKKQSTHTSGVNTKCREIGKAGRRLSLRFGSTLSVGK